MPEYDEHDYSLLRRAALALVELRMRGYDPDRLLTDLRPMLDEDPDEF